MFTPFVTESAAYTVWGISLGIGLVVIVVVGVLLALIARTAAEIEDEVGSIWIAGQRIASNTIHIPLLRRTNLAVARVLDHADGIDQAAAAIEQHAEGCPGCPMCVRGGQR
jgi:hypothetical protein